MARMLYSATMSLDGFIAGPDGDASWMVDHLGPNPEVDGLIDEIGALLVGRRTFGGDDPYKGIDGREGKPFGGGWDGRQFVLTHRIPEGGLPPGVTFVDDLQTAIAAAKSAAGEKYVNILGASVARQCLEAGELDEIFVCVANVMLGGGTRLFHRADGDAVQLERISAGHVPHATNLRFRVRR